MNEIKLVEIPPKDSRAELAVEEGSECLKTRNKEKDNMRDDTLIRGERLK
jgi:hypothetical protein